MQNLSTGFTTVCKKVTSAGCKNSQPKIHEEPRCCSRWHKMDMRPCREKTHCGATLVRALRQTVLLLALAMVCSLAHGGQVDIQYATNLGGIGNGTATDSSQIGGEALNLIVASSGVGTSQGPLVGGVDINTFLGADRFYNAGLTGSETISANIEAGTIWNGHEALSHATDINTPLNIPIVDRHSTWVGGILGGRQGGASPGGYQQGLLPDADLHGGGLASQWIGNAYSFSFFVFGNVIDETYKEAFIDGLTGPTETGTADVINTSFGFPFGNPVFDFAEVHLDAYSATNPYATFVVAAGNSGFGVNTLTSPGTNYNGIAVVALDAATGYETAAPFSSGGFIDYKDPVNGIALNEQPVGPDIAAPGDLNGSAYYGGQTGGNDAALNGSPSGPAGGPDFYTADLSGTSYSAPVVAGGAGLLHDAAQIMLPGLMSARDTRVIKATLLNSADKTMGWDNAQVPHPNGNGGTRTTQALDAAVGAGRMNLDTAYDQYLSGSTDVAGMNGGDQGTVEELGWDLGQVSEGVTNDYFFDAPLVGGTELLATLAWFRDRTFVDPGGNNPFLYTDDSFTDLDLELWSLNNGSFDQLLFDSFTTFNTVEHLAIEIPQTGDYALRVRWVQELFDVDVDDPNDVIYGLAWSAQTVPEPATCVLLAVMGLVAAAMRIRRR